MNNDWLAKAANVGAIIGIPGSIVSFYVDAAPEVSYSVTSVAAILAMGFCYRIVKDKDALGLIWRHPSYKMDFELLANYTRIDIISEDSMQAKYTCTHTFKCRKHSANVYYFRVFPGDNFSNIQVSCGRIIAINNVAAGKDIFVEFDAPCRVDETKSVTLTADTTNVFPATEEFWISQKYYYGNSTNYKIEVFFHQKRPPITHKAEIIVNEDYNNVVKPRQLPSLRIVNGGAVLSCESSDLQDNSKLKLSWSW
ncbi:hypothetical protein SAMN04488128_101202 [Chitinophaga eiseniae]|uniref:Uncharacterized protein n=1 Tax=Chitinophaga eiseniae TaxID=634771 RepID=A0A1T4KLW3_9BACT|nr:hypothetical protein [Chitinophaga eiseniae]SJZ43378.1 hypothetical protein SAMN04488128_101202 [Chitinophaga eiseniae]